jgi:DNA-binding phage protein
LEAGKPTLRLETMLKVLHALGGSLSVDGLD